MNKRTFTIAVLLLFCSRLVAQDTAFYNLTFVSDQQQSMWKTEGFSLDFDYDLFDESWSTGINPDYTTTICGKKFGIGFNLQSSGEMGMNFFLDGLTSGSINKVSYPIEIGFVTPESSSIKAGQIIKIASFFSVKGAPNVQTSYPSGGRAGLKFRFNMDNHIGFKACVFDCIEEGIPFNLNLDTTFFQVGAREGETFFPATGSLQTPEVFCGYQPAIPWPIIDKKNLLPIHIGGSAEPCGCCDSTWVCDSCDCVTTCPEVDCNGDGIYDNGSFAISNYCEAELDLPYIGALQTAIINQNTIQATGEDLFIESSFDPIGAILNYSPTFKLSGDVEIPPPVKCFIDINYNILTASINFDIFNKQTFDFTAEAYAILTLPTKVDYVVKNENGAVVHTAHDSIIEYKIGHDVEFRFPCEYEYMDFNPRIYLKNKFTNRTYNDYMLSLGMEALELNIEFKKIVVVPEITFDIWVPFEGWVEVTTPEVAYDPPDKGIGPLWEDNFPIGNLEQDMFNKSWALEGFPTIAAPPFRVDPLKFKLGLAPDDVVCHNQANGDIILSDVGGTHPLTYEWSNGATTRDLTSVKVGTYYVKATDANQCEAFQGVQVYEPDVLKVAVSKKDCDCHGDQTGSIYLDIEGGIEPYTYLWSDGSTQKDQPAIGAGTHVYTVIDTHGCTYTDSVTIEQPTPLRGYVKDFGTPLCNGSTEGYIKYNVTGGKPPYRYQWSNFAVTRDIDSLQAGTYTVTVNDFNQCTHVTTQVVPEPTLLQDELTVTPISCYKGNDGAIDAAITGGTPPYFITWYSPDFTINNRTQRIENLEEGLYQIEILDSNQCFIKDSVLLAGPEKPFYTEFINTNPSCFAGADGAIELNVQNGTPPYRYEWSTGGTTPQVYDLSAGKYDVTIYDALDCITKNNTVLTEPEDLMANFDVVPVSCREESDGVITVLPSGGNPPFTFYWSNNASGYNIDELAAGNYTATVIDNNNCEYLIETKVPITDVACLHIPSAFTPNGDNVNDNWRIRGKFLYPNNTIKVFTKWGEMVFEAAGDQPDWDGTYKGKQCPAATYYYIIDLGNGDPLYKGLVTIVR